MLLCGGIAVARAITGVCCFFALRPRDGQVPEPALPVVSSRAQEEQRLVCVRPQLNACTDTRSQPRSPSDACADTRKVSQGQPVMPALIPSLS